MKQVVLLLTVVSVLLSGALATFAAVPPMINYQGKLLKPDGTAVVDGTQAMTFAIYAQATGGLPLWSEAQPAVQVKKGLFSVLLGSVNNLPLNIFDSQNRFFGVTVGTDAEMTPRQQVTTTAFAFKAAVADTVVDGGVTTAKLADGAVTTVKLADGAVTGAKLAPDATSSISEAIATGWIPVNETWTYASTDLISSGTNPAKSKYSVGDKVKFTQDGITKYGYIIVAASGDPGIQLAHNTDYTLTNSVITNPYYSHASSPVGFPQWFHYTSTSVGFSTDTSKVSRFKVDGQTCTTIISCVAGTHTSNSTSYTETAPITNRMGQQMVFITGQGVDNGSILTGSTYVTLSNNGTLITCYSSMNIGIWTASGEKRIVEMMVSYPI